MYLKEKLHEALNQIYAHWNGVQTELAAKNKTINLLNDVMRDYDSLTNFSLKEGVYRDYTGFFHFIYARRILLSKDPCETCISEYPYVSVNGKIAFRNNGQTDSPISLSPLVEYVGPLPPDNFYRLIYVRGDKLLPRGNLRKLVDNVWTIVGNSEKTAIPGVQYIEFFAEKPEDLTDVLTRSVLS